MKTIYLLLFIAYIAIETGHYIKYISFVSKMNELIIQKKMSHEYVKYFLSRLKQMTSFEIKKFIHNLFYKKIPVDDISSYNIKNMLSKNMYSLNYDECSQYEISNIKNLYDAIDKKLNNQNINNNILLPHMRYGKNNLTPLYKPFIIYIIYKLAKWYYNYFIFKKNNFKIVYKNNIMFYIKNVTSNLTPVMFFHGLGFGIIPYNKMIMTISQDRTIICPILPNTSNMYFNHNYELFSSSCYLDAIKEILKELNITKIDFVGHSMGTATMTQIANLDNSFINKKIYLDPICFHTRQLKIFKRPYLCFNDNFKKYKNNRQLTNILLSHYFVFTDIYVQILCKRHFWSDEITEIGKNVDNKCFVFVSGRDHIVPAKEIVKYLYEKYISKNIFVNIIYNKDMNHTSLLKSKNHAMILKCLNT